MNLKDLKGMDKDDLLGLLGLETKSSTGAWLAGTLSTFGIGLLVGAGVALMLAPKPGRELREDLRDRLRRAPNDAAEAISSAANRTETLGGVGKTY
jgi:gas vesicle protein